MFEQLFCLMIEMIDTYDNCDLSQQFLNHGSLLRFMG